MQLTLIAGIDTILAHDPKLPSGYDIRPLHESELPELAALYLAAYSREIVEDSSAAEEEMQQTFAGEYGRLVTELSPVVVARGQIVGVVMTVEQAPWLDTPAGLFLIEVITHPDYWRQGLATAGLGWVATRAQEQGFATLALRVASENLGAAALYRKLGFTDWLA